MIFFHDIKEFINKEKLRNNNFRKSLIKYKYKERKKDKKVNIYILIANMRNL